MATSLITAPAPKRRRRSPSISRELRKEVAQNARAMGKKYREQFDADPKLKQRTARLMLALLPPRPSRRGRPRDPQITRAIRLYSKFRRQYPAEKPRAIWSRVCGVLFPRVCRPFRNRAMRQTE